MAKGPGGADFGGQTTKEADTTLLQVNGVRSPWVQRACLLLTPV